MHSKLMTYKKKKLIDLTVVSFIPLHRGKTCLELFYRAFKVEIIYSAAQDNCHVQHQKLIHH